MGMLCPITSRLKPLKFSEAFAFLDVHKRQSLGLFSRFAPLESQQANIRDTKIHDTGMANNPVVELYVRMAPKSRIPCKNEKAYKKDNV